MEHHQLLAGLALLAAIGWLFSAIGWARVVNARGDGLRLEAVRQLALVMAFTCAVTAGAIALSIW